MKQNSNFIRRKINNYYIISKEISALPDRQNSLGGLATSLIDRL
jgi:hypothetical protein